MSLPNIDEIIQALKGRKGKKWDAAFNAVMAMAQRVDSVLQPEIERKNAEARANAKPGETCVVDMSPTWTFAAGVYAQSLNNNRLPSQSKLNAESELRRLAQMAEE